MQYMLLIHTDPANEPAPGTPEFETMMAGYFGLKDRMAGVARVLAGEGLKGPETATRVQLRGGRRLVLDGPHAETREHLGGFYLIEAADLDAALAFAAAIPGAEHGTVEVRPVMDYGGA